MKHQSESLLGPLGIGGGDVCKDMLRKIRGGSFVPLGASALKTEQCLLKAVWRSNCQRESWTLVSGPKTVFIPNYCNSK